MLFSPALTLPEHSTELSTAPPFWGVGGAHSTELSTAPPFWGRGAPLYRTLYASPLLGGRGQSTEHPTPPPFWGVGGAQSTEHPTPPLLGGRGGPLYRTPYASPLLGGRGGQSTELSTSPPLSEDLSCLSTLQLPSAPLLGGQGANLQNTLRLPLLREGVGGRSPPPLPGQINHPQPRPAQPPLQKLLAPRPQHIPGTVEAFGVAEPLGERKSKALFGPVPDGPG